MATDIYQALRESHELQRALCTRLLRAKATDGHARRDTLYALRVELEAHAAAEERFLYAVILMDDRGLKSSRHALAEHHEIEECVEKVQKSDPKGDAWQEHAKALSKKVRHHLKEEESKFFQVSGKILGARQKTALAREYLNDYARMKKTLLA
jgi:hemerythrin superfamily protein